MLIAFEGLDQSGKETQARHLRARLEQDGRRVHAMSFPAYDTPIGQELAKALAGERDYGPDVMQLLYVANRAELRPRLMRWLETGDDVICDRYRGSTQAYGEAFGLSPAWLEDVQRYLPRPDVTLLLDIAPETAAKRKTSGRDRFERDLSLLARVRDAYRRLADVERWVVIDGEVSREDVQAAVERVILSRLVRPSAPGSR